MKKLLKTSVCVLLVLCLCCAVILSGCQSQGVPSLPSEVSETRNAPDPTQSENNDADQENALSVSHNTSYGGVKLSMSYADFVALGYAYGDSVDIRFSNGFTLHDVPFFDSYYAKVGTPMLLSRSGMSMLYLFNCFGEDLWEEAGLGLQSTATVSLAESGKYSSVQQARELNYSNDRSQYASDEIFANFRSLSGGKLKPNTVYRSSSPCDNEIGRASYADTLMKAAGVKCVVNLTDDMASVSDYVSASDYNSPYYAALYEDDKVYFALLTDLNYGSESFKSSVVIGMKAIVQNDGPYLIHCIEGKDRTGFICVVLESLAGASYEEIVADYMTSYENYGGFTKESDPDRYAIIVEYAFDPMVAVMVGSNGADIKTADLSACAAAYLKSCGMSDADIQALQTKLTA